VIPVGSGLHLKSDVNDLGNSMLIITEAFAALEALKPYDLIVLDNADGYAANTLRVNDSLIMPEGFPNAREKLTATGLISLS